MSIEELEAVVSSLPAAELARFSEWFEEFMADQWDRQIEQDVLARRFDAAIKRANDHYEVGRCTPLRTTLPTRISGSTTASFQTASAQ